MKPDDQQALDALAEVYDRAKLRPLSEKQIALAAAAAEATSLGLRVRLMTPGDLGPPPEQPFIWFEDDLTPPKEDLEA